jgi:hypothetical protein
MGSSWTCSTIHVNGWKTHVLRYCLKSVMGAFLNDLGHLKLDDVECS